MFMKLFDRILKSLVVRTLQSKALRGFGYWFDNSINSHWNNFPFGKKVLAEKNTYERLWEEECQNVYPEIELYEKKLGYSINSVWLQELALHTQVVLKNSPLCWQHGRILYSTISSWLNSHQSEEYKAITIWETGTARGFSSLCMSKALFDMERFGKIITFDVLPHNKKMFWNCIDDHEGPKTRSELLRPWRELVSRYIFFQQGDSKLSLNKVAADRIHFAFLDGSHTYDDVIFEFKKIKDFQLSGDIVVYDDYNEDQFPGLVKAVNFICENFRYKAEVIFAYDRRGYVVTTKI
jgi:hypothetical protein